MTRFLLLILSLTLAAPATAQFADMAPAEEENSERSVVFQNAQSPVQEAPAAPKPKQPVSEPVRIDRKSVV